MTSGSASVSATDMHIDTEGNAADLAPGAIGILIKAGTEVAQNAND